RPVELPDTPHRRSHIPHRVGVDPNRLVPDRLPHRRHPRQILTQRIRMIGDLHFRRRTPRFPHDPRRPRRIDRGHSAIHRHPIPHRRWPPHLRLLHRGGQPPRRLPIPILRKSAELPPPHPPPNQHPLPH